jgi:hypothetical protein
MKSENPGGNRGIADTDSVPKPTSEADKIKRGVFLALSHWIRNGASDFEGRRLWALADAQRKGVR